MLRSHHSHPTRSHPFSVSDVCFSTDLLKRFSTCFCSSSSSSSSSSFFFFLLLPNLSHATLASLTPHPQPPLFSKRCVFLDRPAQAVLNMVWFFFFFFFFPCPL